MNTTQFNTIGSTADVAIEHLINLDANRSEAYAQREAELEQERQAEQFFASEEPTMTFEIQYWLRGEPDAEYIQASSREEARAIFENEYPFDTISNVSSQVD